MANPLARAVMGNNLKHNKTENMYKQTHNNNRKNDGDTDLTQLINNLIQGESKVKVVEETTSINEKITLEEAANRVRKGL